MVKYFSANVHGLSLKPLMNPIFDSTGLENLINSNIIDIRDELLVKELINDIKPDFIFHMAFQPLVGISYEEPKLTYETNFLGL